MSTRNKVSLREFIDLYSVQAIKFHIERASDPFDHRIERLAEDCAEWEATVLPDFALCLRDTLFLMATGEARHSARMCRETAEAFASDRYDPGRDTWFERALDYDVDRNLPVLAKIFGQRWSSSGYGGRAWAQIVRGAMLYGRVPDAAFADHVADLEHNGGVLFNKSEVSIIGFDTELVGAYSFKHFLDYKFGHDLVIEPWHHYSPSPMVRRMVNRARAILFGTEPARWAYMDEYARTRYEYRFRYVRPTWGTELFGDLVDPNRTTCDCCGESCSDEYHAQNEYGSTLDLCEDCYQNSATSCEICGQTYTESAVQTVHLAGQSWDKTVCSDCLNGLDTCTGCGKYMTGWSSYHHDSGDYCPDCHYGKNEEREQARSEAAAALISITATEPHTFAPSDFEGTFCRFLDLCPAGQSHTGHDVILIQAGPNVSRLLFKTLYPSEDLSGWSFSVFDNAGLETAISSCLPMPNVGETEHQMFIRFLLDDEHKSVYGSPTKMIFKSEVSKILGIEI